MHEENTCRIPLPKRRWRCWTVTLPGDSRTHVRLKDVLLSTGAPQAQAFLNPTYHRVGDCWIPGDNLVVIAGSAVPPLFQQAVSEVDERQLQLSREAAC